MSAKRWGRAVKTFIALPTICAVALLVAGSLPAATEAPSWTGRWTRPLVEAADKESQVFTLRQRGNLVTGRHTIAGAFIDVGCNTGRGGVIEGRAHGRELEARITWPRASGTVYLTLSPNGRRIEGRAGVFHGQCTGSWFPFNARKTG